MLRQILNITFIIAMCIVLLGGCNTIRFDNTTNKSDMLTETYSVSQMEIIKESLKTKNGVKTGDMTFSFFNKFFDAQCVRKTHQGYYAVLLLDDGENAFVFFNNENILTGIIVTNGFQSEEDFCNLIDELKHKNGILSNDPNAYLFPVSSIDMTAHIVQEGIIIIKYERFMNGVRLKDPVVISVELIDNDSIATNDDCSVREDIPYILEIDKVG